MEHIFYENNVNELNGNPIDFSSTTIPTYKVRIKVKEGVSTFTTLFSSRYVTMIFDGENLIPYSASFVVKGEGDIVLFLKNTATSNLNFKQNVTAANISNFLSQIEVLHNPLPFLTSRDSTLTITSPNFSAPNGIFDLPFYFTGFSTSSTFKEGPKIFSDFALSSMATFPPEPTIPLFLPSIENRIKGVYPTTNSIYHWRPFYNLNVERILPQGTISGKNLIFVNACDLTYRDEQGFTKLDAYPIMEATPKCIVDYIKGEKVKISEIPNNIINTSKAEKVFMPLEFETYYLDSKPNLPLAGMDFRTSTHHMQNLTLDKMMIDSSHFSPTNSEYNDYTISYLHFGIVAPESCTVVENVHTLWANYAEPEPMEETGDYLEYKLSLKNHLLTLDTMEEVDTLWASELRDFLEDEEFDGHVFYDDNMAPLLPENVQRLTGYMCKLWLINDYIFLEEDGSISKINYYYKGNEAGFFKSPSSEQRVMYKDGEKFIWKMEELNLYNGEDGQLGLTETYRNLFSNQFLDLDEPIVVPKKPSCKSLIFHGAAMFANTTGSEVEVEENFAEPSTYTVTYTESVLANSPISNGTKYSIKVEPLDRLGLSGSFWNKFDSKNDSNSYVFIDGVYLGTDTYGYPKISPNGLTRDDFLGFKDVYNFYGEENQESNLIKKVTQKSSLTNLLYTYGHIPQSKITHKINEGIIFEDNEDNAYSVDSTLYTWAQLFFGSSPKSMEELSVPYVPVSEKNVEDFNGAFLYKYVENSIQYPLTLWGYFEYETTDDVTIGSVTKGVKYAINIFYDDNDNEIEDFYSAGFDTIEKLSATSYLWTTSRDYSLPRVHRYLQSVSFWQLGENEVGDVENALISKEIDTPAGEFYTKNNNFAYFFTDQMMIDKRFQIASSVKRNITDSTHLPLKNPNANTTIRLGLGYRNTIANFGLKKFGDGAFLSTSVYRNPTNVNYEQTTQLTPSSIY